jgi:hypothetical protein
MSKLEERILIYTALSVVCAIAGIFAGLEGAVFSFVLIAVVIEGLYWFGVPRARVASHRMNRILFN